MVLKLNPRKKQEAILSYNLYFFYFVYPVQLSLLQDTFFIFSVTLALNLAKLILATPNLPGVRAALNSSGTYLLVLLCMCKLF